MRAALSAFAVASLAALGLPAAASAHGGGGPVAVDFRLELDTAPAGLGASPKLGGDSVRLFESDRAVELSLPARSVVVVRGTGGEPMLRLDEDGAWANADSQTAQASRLVSRADSGWIRVGGSGAYAWHDVRLRPDGPAGAVTRFSIPLTVEGRPAQIAGAVVSVDRPPLLPWLAAAAAFAAGIAVAVWRTGPGRAVLAVVVGTAAALAALTAIAGFAIGADPGAGVPWFQAGTSLALAVALAGLLVVARGRAQVVAAGVVGAVTAAVGLSALPVFWHGVVLSALPGAAARAAVGVALVCGTAAALLSLLFDFDREPRPETRRGR
jgi:hypothetical protein